jgi:hypothetical protein
MKYTNQIFCIRGLILSLLTNVVIFFVNPHKFIPTLSAMSITIDEHIIVLKVFIPLTIISKTAILVLGYTSAYYLHLYISYLKFIIFINPKLGTGALRNNNELDSLNLVY